MAGHYIGYRSVAAVASGVASDEDFVFKTVPLQEQLSTTPARDEGIVDTVLKSLSRSTKYEIIVQSYNSKGAGPASEAVAAVTFQEGGCLSVCV